MIGGITICDKNTNAKRKSVQQIALVNPGTGYTAAPKIKFTGAGVLGPQERLESPLQVELELLL